MAIILERGRVGTELLISYLVPRLRTPQKSFGPSLGAKKSRKCDLATALRFQRRYKSIKRKYSLAQRTAKHLELFLGGRTKDLTQRAERGSTLRGPPAGRQAQGKQRAQRGGAWHDGGDRGAFGGGVDVVKAVVLRDSG